MSPANIHDNIGLFTEQRGLWVCGWGGVTLIKDIKPPLTRFSTAGAGYKLGQQKSSAFSQMFIDLCDLKEKKKVNI